MYPYSQYIFLVKGTDFIRYDRMWRFIKALNHAQKDSCSKYDAQLQLFGPMNFL